MGDLGVSAAPAAVGLAPRSPVGPSPYESPRAIAWPPRPRPREPATESDSAQIRWVLRPLARAALATFVAPHRASIPTVRSRSTGIAVSRSSGDSVRQSDTVPHPDI